MLVVHSVDFNVHTSIRSKCRAHNTMTTTMPMAIGEYNTLIKSFLGVVAEKAVMAMSPKTRPKVPASVASNPDYTREQRIEGKREGERREGGMEGEREGGREGGREGEKDCVGGRDKRWEG